MQILKQRLEKISQNLYLDTEPRLIMIDKDSAKKQWHIQLKYFSNKGKSVNTKDIYTENYEEYIKKYKNNRDIPIIVDNIE